MSELLFISDLHLSPDRPDTAALFRRFLRERAPQSDALYILGDLFDAWVGDDDPSPFAAEIQQALQELSRHGTRLYVQHGNRDFLLGKAFAERTGAELLDEERVITLPDGRRALLLHGDQLCTDDTDYQRARLMLRSPAFISNFLAKRIPERIAIATEYRKRSGESTSLKADEIMDVNQETVEQHMRRHGVHCLIHGHTHRPGQHRFLLDAASAERHVMGEWHGTEGSLLTALHDGLTLAGYR